MTSPPRDWTRPRPSVTYSVCPLAWQCQAVCAPGANRTMLTRNRDGSSPLAMTSNHTSPENISAGPLLLGCLAWISKSLLFTNSHKSQSRPNIPSTLEGPRRPWEVLPVPALAGPPATMPPGTIPLRSRAADAEKVWRYGDPRSAIPFPRHRAFCVADSSLPGRTAPWAPAAVRQPACRSAWCSATTLGWARSR